MKTKSQMSCTRTWMPARFKPRVILYFFLCIFPGSVLSQSIYTANDYGHFRANLNAAMNRANSLGEDVQLLITGNFGTDPNTSVPIILTQGSLTIKSQTTMRSIDGSGFSAHANPFIIVQSITGGAKLSIENIEFKNFILLSDIIKLNFDTKNVTIKDCYFHNCDNSKPYNYNCERIIGMSGGSLWCIRSNSSNKIVIDNCDFEDNNNSIQLELTNPSNIYGRSVISNNNFENTSSFSKNYEEIRIVSLDPFNNSYFDVFGNVIKNDRTQEPSIPATAGGYFKRAFSVLNDLADPEQSTLDINIHDNTVIGAFHFVFYLKNSLRRWRVVENNLLNGAFANGNQNSSGGFWHPALIVVDDKDFNGSEYQGVFATNEILGLNLVDNNILAYPLENKLNSFCSAVNQRNKYLSISIPEYGARFIGLDLPGSISIIQHECGVHGTCYAHSNIIMRQCKIRTSVPHKPIAFGDGCVQAYSIDKLEYCEGMIYADVSTPCPFDIANHGDYVVDLYTSNLSNGDLLDYIGNFTLDPLSTSPYHIEIPVPPGITMSAVERIGATVTSLGNLPGATLEGTSVVFYKQPSPCCCKDIAVTYSNQPRGGYVSGCVGSNLAFSAVCSEQNNTAANSVRFDWSVDGGAVTSTIPGQNFETSFSSPGMHSISVTSFLPGVNCSSDARIEPVYISACTTNCYDCIPSFSPVPGETYVVSSWVREATVKTNYTKPQLIVTCSYNNPPINFPPVTCIPKGKVIDGWQRIEEVFQVPGTATNISIKLKSTTSENVYFDDLRIYPSDGSMKSYVYDPFNFRFVAELDERNYSTFYEYDQEGKLIRIKKETEKGIMTIKEVRNNSAFAK